MENKRRRGCIMFQSKYCILKLIDLFDAKIKGRKRLQKLSYIMKDKGYPIPQDFIYYHYGPYSRELSATIAELVSFGLLNETQTPQVYEYGLTEEGKEFINLLEEKNFVEKIELNEKLKNVIKSVKDQDPSLLELVSTILFLQDYGESFKNACDKALELKPHLKSYLENATEIISNLNE